MKLAILLTFYAAVPALLLDQLEDLEEEETKLCKSDTTLTRALLGL